MGVPCILYFFRTKWTYWACSFYVKTYKLETIASFFALGLKDKNGSLITWLEGTQDITYTIKNDDEDLKESAILITLWIQAQKCGIIGLWRKHILDNFDNQNQGEKIFWISTLSFLGLSWHAPINPAWRAGWPMLVRWQLERPMYNFKNSFLMVFSTFIE